MKVGYDQRYIEFHDGALRQSGSVSYAREVTARYVAARSQKIKEEEEKKDKGLKALLGIIAENPVRKPRSERGR